MSACLIHTRKLAKQAQAKGPARRAHKNGYFPFILHLRLQHFDSPHLFILFFIPFFFCFHLHVRLAFWFDLGFGEVLLLKKILTIVFFEKMCG